MRRVVVWQTKGLALGGAHGEEIEGAGGEVVEGEVPRIEEQVKLNRVAKTEGFVLLSFTIQLFTITPSRWR